MTQVKSTKIAIAPSSISLEEEEELEPRESTYKATVIMIHGFPDTSSTFDEMREVLEANNYNCLVLDLPGYSLSEDHTWTKSYGQHDFSEFDVSLVDGYLYLVFPLLLLA